MTSDHIMRLLYPAEWAQKALSEPTTSDRLREAAKTITAPKQGAFSKQQQEKEDDQNV